MNNETIHKSVLTQEVVSGLTPQAGKIYVDATFGCGGHSRAILAAEPNCSVIGIDWDKTTLDRYAPALQEEFGDRFKPVWGNFASLYKLLRKHGIGAVDGIIADFGTSQYQIFERDGFSFRQDSPLDMRMSSSHSYFTASNILNRWSSEKLANLLWQLGGERHARRIAEAIVQHRQKEKITSTEQLAQIIIRAVPRQKLPTRGRRQHAATRTFQALRIFINKELSNVEHLLRAAIGVLAPQGKVLCISFHSLEDRIVKHFFRDATTQLHTLTKKPIIPSLQEIATNTSARSAKLRIAEKIS